MISMVSAFHGLRDLLIIHLVSSSIKGVVVITPGGIREVPGTEAAIQRSDCHALHPVSFSLHLTQAHADYSWGRGFGRRVSKTPREGLKLGTADT